MGLYTEKLLYIQIINPFKESSISIEGIQMNEENEFQELVAQFQDMVEKVATDREINNPDLRRVLRFIIKVAQVVDQAFRDIYAVLIEFKYLTVDDVRSGRLQDLKRELELLRARDRFRDAEQICSRLHHLSEQYEDQIHQIILHLEDPGRWHLMFKLLGEYEGWIIDAVNRTIFELESMLRESSNETSVDRINQLASEKIDTIRTLLVKLQSLCDQILGFSGRTGFIELTETDRSSLEKQVNVFFQDRSTTYGNRTDLKNVSGQTAVGSNILQETTSELRTQEAIMLIEQLKQSIMKEEKLSPRARERVVRQLEEAKEEAKESTPDKEYIAANLKKAADIIKQAGILINAATNTGKLLLGLIEWSGLNL